MRKTLSMFVALAALAIPAAVQAAPAMTVGDPKDPGALAQAIQAAYTGGARRIAIRPGTYLLPSVGHTAITLDGWKGATLSAYKVTLIITDLAWAHDVFDIVNCNGVTLAGPTLSQTSITSYQGRVVAIGKDAAGKAYCDWRPDAGYPVPPASEKGFLGGNVNVVDAHTRLLKIGCGDFYGAPYQVLPDGAFRVQMGGNIAVGDWLVGRYGNAPFKVDIRNSRDCTLRDVTLMRNGFAPLREEGGGGNHYLHCVWALGAAPGGGDRGASGHQRRRRDAHDLLGPRPRRRELRLPGRLPGRLHRHPRLLQDHQGLVRRPCHARRQRRGHPGGPAGARL